MSDQKEQKQKNKKMENMREYFKKTENKEVKKTFLQRKMFMSKKIIKRERERHENK